MYIFDWKKEEDKIQVINEEKADGLNSRAIGQLMEEVHSFQLTQNTEKFEISSNWSTLAMSPGCIGWR